MISPRFFLERNYFLVLCVILLLTIRVRGDFWDPVLNTSYQNIVSCSICDDLNLPLLDDVRPDENSNITCRDYHDYLSQPKNRVLCSGSFLFASEKCCDWSNSTPLNQYECDENIRKQLFEKHTMAPPYMNSMERIKIEVSLMYQGTTSVDVKESTASIFANVNLKWHDPRLAWNITPSMCRPLVSDVTTSIEMGYSEIWVPNFNLHNRAHGTESFAPTRAFVLHDGTVMWTRVGVLKAFCSFRGLRKIPYDTLGCQFIFGDSVGDSGYEFVTAKNSMKKGEFKENYVEFEMDENMTEISYLGHREGVIYNLYFKRATNFYIFSILLPTIFLTYTSFGIFVLSIDTSERLGFGITIVLVIVAQEIVTYNYIPISHEPLWLALFVRVSAFFTYIGLFETLLAHFFFYSSVRNQEQVEKNSEEDGSLVENDTLSQETPAAPEENYISTQETSATPSDKPKRKTMSWILRQNYIKAGHGEDPRRYIKRFDTILVCLLPLAYTIFIIVMYGTVKNRDDGYESWLSGEPVD